MIDAPRFVVRLALAAKRIARGVKRPLHVRARREAPRDADRTDRIEPIRVLKDRGFDRRRHDPERERMNADRVRDRLAAIRGTTFLAKKARGKLRANLPGQIGLRMPL